MKHMQALAAQAIVGTERLSAPTPTVDGAVGELLTQLAGQDVATGLLRAAGVLAVCGRAGHNPPPCGALAPCSPDSLPAADQEMLAQTLGHILSDSPDRLRAEALGLLQAHARTLPHRLLPAALDQGRRNGALRPFLHPALGERGRWLATHNPHWSYASEQGVEAPQAADWDTGTAAQREALLRQERAIHPAGGRERLAECFAELGARERAALVAVLEEGLGAEDEAFLEAALRDRSKEVRQTAAGLLGRIAGSAYVQRMAQRLDACLRSEHKLFRATLTIEAPENFGAGWKEDNIEEAKPNGEKLGQHAWWLLQLVRAVPASWWEERTSMDPGALLNWAGKTDWRDALYRGWSDALDREADAAWAEALLARPALPGIARDRWALVATLPPARREQHWHAMLANRSSNEHLGSMLDTIFKSLPLSAHALSDEFSLHVLQQVQGSLQAGSARWDYALRSALPEFACLLPDQLFETAQLGWPAAAPENEFITEALARLHAIIEQRRILHHHLPIKRAPS